MQGISMRNISKNFAGKPALQGVDIEIKKGTVHAIVGENGAGKSTLMNILCGVLRPTEGDILIDGEKVMLEHPQDATKHGIGMVHQHFMLVPSLTVWQNIILGIEPVGSLGTIDKKAAIKLLADACGQFGMQAEPEQIVGSLTVGEQQRIEIIKVLVRSAEYIILDEPTAVLTPQETQRLFENIKALRQSGKTVIFISHKLEEVFEIADEITALRLGKKIATKARDEVDADSLVRMMVGREVDLSGWPAAQKPGAVALQVQRLCTPGSAFTSGLDDISFEIREGEILGVAGVDGNGQDELVRALFGLEAVSAGRIVKDGAETTQLPSAKIREKGFALIPPDRQKQGLVMDSPVLNNLVLGCETNPAVCGRLFFKGKEMKDAAQRLAGEYDIRMPSLGANAAELSGGNQQKAILAREIGLRNTNLIVAVNPTRGLDIGAIEFIYTELENRKAQGRAVLLVSTDLGEILRLCDRIAVLFKGRVMGIVERAQATPENLGMLMMGIAPEGKGGAATV